VDQDQWVRDNAARVIEALTRPDVALEPYNLLGGQADPERQREALALEVSRLRLTWRPGQSTDHLAV
jgi:hypothetical protein